MKKLYLNKKESWRKEIIWFRSLFVTCQYPEGFSWLTRGAFHLVKISGISGFPEHVSSVHATRKFPEKVENLKRWARFPGWNFRTECRVPFTFLVVCTSSRSTGVYDQMEQLFTDRKFHFCSHRNFRVFLLNGKRPNHPKPRVGKL